MRIINTALIANPLNWITILVMLIIFVIGFDTAASLWHTSAAKLPTTTL